LRDASSRCLPAIHPSFAPSPGFWEFSSSPPPADQDHHSKFSSPVDLPLALGAVTGGTLHSRFPEAAANPWHVGCNGAVISIFGVSRARVVFLVYYVQHGRCLGLVARQGRYTAVLDAGNGIFSPLCSVRSSLYIVTVATTSYMIISSSLDRSSFFTSYFLARSFLSSPGAQDRGEILWLLGSRPRCTGRPSPRVCLGLCVLS
jgi:hypothetical protein